MQKTALILLLLSIQAIAQNQNFEGKYNALIPKLDHESFEERNNIQEQILKLSLTQPEEAINKLLSTNQNHENPEIRNRSLGILKQIYTKKFAPPAIGYLGIQHSQTQVQFKGELLNATLVLGIEPNTPADKAGLIARDVILKIDNQDLSKIPILDMADSISSIIKQKGAGTTISLEVLRNEKKIKIQATLSAYPEALRRRNKLDLPQDNFDLWLNLWRQDNANKAKGNLPHLEEMEPLKP